MGLIIPASAYEDFNSRLGFTRLSHCTGSEPHYAEARDLELVLKAYDPQLEVGFVRNFGEVGKWAVNRVGPDGSQVLARTIEEPDGSYRRPDQRVVLSLQRGDLGRREVRDELLGKADEREECRHAHERREMEGEIAEFAAKKLRDAGNSQREDLDPLTVGMAEKRAGRRAPNRAA